MTRPMKGQGKAVKSQRKVKERQRRRRQWRGRKAVEKAAERQQGSGEGGHGTELEDECAVLLLQTRKERQRSVRRKAVLQ